VIDFLQTTEGVVTAASVYLLVGLAWNLTYNACGYLNLALGQYYILGAIFSYKLQTSADIHNVFLLAVLVIGAVGVIGYLSERFLLRPLKDHRLAPLIVTIGINLVLLQLAKRLSPSSVLRPETFVEGTVTVGGVHITYQELIVWGTALVLTIALFFFFTRTDMGRSMRACQDNRKGAEALGIKVPSYSTAAFTVGAMLAATAAFVVGPTQGVAYNSGDLIAIKAFMAVSIVGLGRNGGALFGAFLVAGGQGYIARYWSNDISEIVVLVGFLCVLYVYAARESGHNPWRLPSALRRTRPPAAEAA
jgi:branched-chain amino acid transport system permease protein